MNKEKIEKCMKEILKEIGEDVDREGLKETPNRVARMYEEIFRGYDKKQTPKVTIFPNGMDGITYTQMIIDTGNFYSHCEHHMKDFFGKYWFAYIPSKKGNLLGISKVARVVDFFAAKLQVQERLTQEIVDCLWDELITVNSDLPVGMALIMKAKHLCKSSRGVKKDGYMTTSEMRGEFLTPDITKGNAREEFLQLVSSEIGELR